MALDLLKAFILGICVAAPLGPVAVMVVQRTLCCSRKAGFFTGLGGVTVDTTWAAVGLLALGAIRDFVNWHQEVIMIAGGALIAVFGAVMLLSNPFARAEGKTDTGGKMIAYTAQTAACAFANPAALAVMLAMLAVFKLDASSLHLPVLAVLPAVFAGGSFYWYVVSGIFAHFGNRLNLKTLLWINRVAGALVLVFGIILVVKGIRNII